MAQSVHVTVAHSLSQTVAFDRVLAWLNAQRGQNTHIIEQSFNADFANHTITIKLIVYGYPVTAVLTISPSLVDLRTSEATDIVEGVSMVFAQGRIQRELTQQLK